MTNFKVTIGNISASTWQAQNLSLELKLSATEKNIAITAQARQFSPPTFKQPLENLIFLCNKMLYSPEQIACSKATLTIPRLLDSPTTLVFSYLPNPLKIEITLNQLLNAGNLNAQLLYQIDNWKASLMLKNLNLGLLTEKINPFIALPLDLALEGIATVNATFLGANQLQKAEIKTTLNTFKFTENTGSKVGEKLAVDWTVSAEPSTAKQQQESGLAIQSTLKMRTGELYIQPVYLSFQEKPLNIDSELLWFPSRLIIKRLQYAHEGIGTVIATGDIDLANGFNINALSARLPLTTLLPIYTHYVQPIFEGNLLAKLTVEGALSLNLLLSKDRLKISGGLSNIVLEDIEKKFGLRRLVGTFEWDSKTADKPTNVKWDSAYVLSDITMGSAQLYANLGGEKIQLLAPLKQPILDGVFRVDSFDLTGGFGEKMYWELKGLLQPISMQAISKVLKLPLLNGYLGGTIPSIRYQQGVITIGGVLQLNIFDGKILVQRMTLESLSTAPVLKADVEINKINLKTLTDITEFGAIQGLLSGYVRNLYLVNWQPVTFDAYVGTPEEQSMTRKISQKAVNNLSNLGGGGAIDALSRGVLSIFENFSYEKLGLGCRLQNGTCTMWGAETAPNGYYIVKGGGLPRIDVVGYNERVNWLVLLARLASITKTSAPVIK
ncbi:hypothetical protein [Beggiatoa leptomitoformis]|uniref:Dicarboxylate transport domain-containing protein n=1 Tax=Beggiatoa leptomitoformis TaxID=288004 RepID=A0A2N9YBV8_9GAMM|nr:hypothetical protein [Beggiatoa leptomitoformis]ALG66739.2 hypothetical protein AL038_02180 [Beggiatoa leptomitoformis]AUI67922.2 hypothetical protein BLE401_03860 [Beggiatoa leptomitoformis]